VRKSSYKEIIHCGVPGWGRSSGDRFGPDDYRGGSSGVGLLEALPDEQRGYDSWRINEAALAAVSTWSASGSALETTQSRSSQRHRSLDTRSGHRCWSLLSSG